MSPFVDSVSCIEIIKVIESLIDGELGATETAAVEAHLESCADCAAERRHSEEIRAQLRALPMLDLPETLLSEVERATRNDAPSVSGRFVTGGLFRHGPKIAVAVAAAVLLLVVSLWNRAPQPTVSQMEAERAAAEARLALAYVADMTRRAERVARARVIEDDAVATTIRSVSRSLQWAGGSGGGKVPPVPTKKPDIEGSSS